MRCKAILAAIALTVSRLFAGPTPAYYAAVTNQTGPNLRAALHQVIRAHRVIPYSSSTRLDTSAALKYLDRYPADTNRVHLIYSTNTATLDSFGTTAGWAASFA